MNRQAEVQVSAKSGPLSPRVPGEPPGVWHGLHVRYRYAGTRRWTTFHVEAAEGQTLIDTIGVAIAVVAGAEQAEGHHVGQASQLLLDGLEGAAA